MVTIDSNNVISMTRGDSWSAPLFLNRGTALKPMRKILSSRDAVYLAIMEPNQPFEDAIIKKVFTNKDVNKNKDVVVKITPDDTACLIPGKYFYQIKAKFINTAESMNVDIEVVDETYLLAGSKLRLGSILNGKPVKPSSENSQYYILPANSSMRIGDLILTDSIIQAGSTINNSLVEEEVDVNTVVQKTEFIILE